MKEHRHVHAIAVETVLARDGLPVVEVSTNVMSLLRRVGRQKAEVEYAPEGSTNLVTLQNVSVTTLDTAIATGSTYTLAGLEVNL